MCWKALFNTSWLFSRCLEVIQINFNNSTSVKSARSKTSLIWDSENCGVNKIWFGLNKLRDSVNQWNYKILTTSPKNIHANGLVGTKVQSTIHKLKNWDNKINIPFFNSCKLQGVEIKHRWNLYTFVKTSSIIIYYKSVDSQFLIILSGST